MFLSICNIVGYLTSEVDTYPHWNLKNLISYLKKKPLELDKSCGSTNTTWCNNALYFQWWKLCFFGVQFCFCLITTLSRFLKCNFKWLSAITLRFFIKFRSGRPCCAKWRCIQIIYLNSMGTGAASEQNKTNVPFRCTVYRPFIIVLLRHVQID